MEHLFLVRLGCFCGESWGASGLIRFDGAACLVIATLFLLLPLKWMLAVITAALIHELGHIFSVLLLKGRIHGIHLGLYGARIDAQLNMPWQDLVSILAGPMASLFLAVLCRNIPILCLCSLLQGCVNLLPIWPLDGGRALTALLEVHSLHNHHQIQASVEWSTAFLIGMLTVYGARQGGWGYGPAFLWFIWVTQRLLRKIPCKPRQNTLQ